MAETIHPDTRVGPVHLTVRDLERSVAFYRDRLGFQVRRRTDEVAKDAAKDAAKDVANGVAYLGAGGPDLLVLTENPSAVQARGTTGLYHFAILVPSRHELARSLERLVATRTRLTGASDHLVSEALYLNDPDGNGIEIYRDRPRGEWGFERGEVRMATEALDLGDVLDELDADAVREVEGAGWRGLSPQTVIGHIHLHVADLAAAEEFYVGRLGFERMARYGPSAVFVAAGGYHHHIGLNTWQGVGAPPPPPGAVGLRHFVIQLPDADEVARMAERLVAAGVAVEEVEGGVIVRDPSGNRILLVIDPA